MTRRIVIIAPLVDSGAFSVEPILATCARPDVALDHHFLREGPLSVETDADVAACTPGVVALGWSLAVDGADAIIVNCMCDPGVAELRREISCPVLGPCETAMHFAAGLGLRFGLIDILEESRPETERLVDRFGVRTAFASYRAIGIPVLELHTDRHRTLEALVHHAAQAVRDDGADALILGCTGFTEFADEIRLRLAATGLRPLLIEPMTLAVDMARMALNLRHG